MVNGNDAGGQQGNNPRNADPLAGGGLPEARPGYVLLALFLVILMGIVAWYVPITRPTISGAALSTGTVWGWAWLTNLAVMFLALGAIGLSLGKGFWGVFVDDRNMVSLSRFQIVLWTAVIMSAFLTIAVARVSDSSRNSDGYVCEPVAVATPSPTGGQETPALTGQKPPSETKQPPCAGPVDIQLPELLWALMGISVASSVLSPLIKADKQNSTSRGNKQTLYAQTLTRTLEQSGDTTVRSANAAEKEFSNVGAVVVRNPNFPPQFADMFRGEEASNFLYVDIAKVQNFLFTVVAVLTYGVALYVAVSSADTISQFFQFPDLSDGLVAILGISHAGYLTKKAAVTPPPDQ